jgi:hypothetical protein
MERDLENVVDLVQVKFGSCSKTAALQGRCDGTYVCVA